jgi:hypothetical protein
MIKFKVTGDFSKTVNSLKKLKEFVQKGNLDKYGQMGVDALKQATPRRTGKTAESWDYEIVTENNKVSIYWVNNNIQNGVNIAVILQYGHGTKSGRYVEGIDYINPAMKPIFEEIADKAWKEVIRL